MFVRSFRGDANEAGLSLCQADHIMADEFSAELADGVAFVSGHDDDGRPVVVRTPFRGRADPAIVPVKCLRLYSWSFREAADKH